MLNLLKYITTRHAYHVCDNTVIISGKWFDEVNKHIPSDQDDPSIIIHNITKCIYMCFDDQPDYLFSWNEQYNCYSANK